MNNKIIKNDPISIKKLFFIKMFFFFSFFRENIIKKQKILKTTCVCVSVFLMLSHFFWNNYQTPLFQFQINLLKDNHIWALRCSNYRSLPLPQLKQNYRFPRLTAATTRSNLAKLWTFSKKANFLVKKNNEPGFCT